ncbi:LytR C-terminal domain-containing protein [Kineosporia succinea]|uniref:LytR/CpsA/Psr regulator C-terminal domain-containing protein n=1 Tax=Kineosporia succinea TaxID=84632 RepID=A0ABT9P924_9ACTN|nr:LytR C-terminal domain-containing protein [Kineosporia succinea]MDP9829051.1 hypothetical protein [Kineosporia succinea]
MSATKPPGYDARPAEPEGANRRGAHRPRTKPAGAILPVVAGVAVVLLAIAGVVTVIGNRGSEATSSAGKQGFSEDTDTAATPGASGGTQAPGDDETATETEKAADQSIEVVVWNSLDIEGLATDFKNDLEAEGWTIDSVDNSPERNLATTQIYYGDADLEATAEGVRTALDDLGEVTENADVNPGKITVVLGQDTQD